MYGNQHLLIRMTWAAWLWGLWLSADIENHKYLRIMQSLADFTLKCPSLGLSERTDPSSIKNVDLNLEELLQI